MPRKSLVYLDANVLIPSVTRGLLIIGAVSSDFRVCWTEFGEAEAQRHQHPRAAKLSDLRLRFGWNVLVPEGDATGMVDTDQKDRSHLAAAHSPGACLIITENIKDFGNADLDWLSMSVVAPDLFLSVRLEEHSYVEVLNTLVEGRTREPSTPVGIHGQEVAPRLPMLADRFAPSMFRSTRPLRIRWPRSFAVAGASAAIKFWIYQAAMRSASPVTLWLRERMLARDPRSHQYTP